MQGLPIPGVQLDLFLLYSAECVHKIMTVLMLTLLIVLKYLSNEHLRLQI